MPDLLIELFSEEIPARMQARASEDLKRLVCDGMRAAGLDFGAAEAFATPRRLTLSVAGLSPSSPTLREERRGPRVDAPDKAVEGFLRGAGVSRGDLVERDEKKGRFYYANVVTEGRPAGTIVAEVLEKTIRTFPWPKSMRWGDGNLRWVRPLQRILCILTSDTGTEVVPLHVDGLRSADITEGHRFMAPSPFSVVSFEDYVRKLKSAHVVLSAEERAKIIMEDAQAQADTHGLAMVDDPGLLREVAGLVEWPVVLVGEIAPEFLGLPPEVLQTSMKEHQKFFSLRDEAGQIRRFVTVANRETADSGATILAGNQKVLAARLSDAKFFWENDLRVARSDINVWIEALENVTFHRKIGSQAERVARIVSLARHLAPIAEADAEVSAQAAGLAKADLSSEMVYEFPELQGVMGRYYIKASGAPDAVAEAATAHYQPLGPSDAVSEGKVSVTVALADKLDLLMSMWAIGEKPTGSGDPFALRRAALGVIRIVLHHDLRLRLAKFIQDMKPDAKADDLVAFFHDRLKVYLRDRGMSHDVIDACIAMSGADDLTLLVKRAEALAEALKTDDGGNLVQGFKRANNILSQAEAADGVEYSFGADRKFAEDPAELALFDALSAQRPKITAAMKAEDFATAMVEMAHLRQPIDTFFDAVQVNTSSSVTRRNRLNMLGEIRNLCGSVADLTRLQG